MGDSGVSLTVQEWKPSAFQGPTELPVIASASGTAVFGVRQQKIVPRHSGDYDYNEGYPPLFYAIGKVFGSNVGHTEQIWFAAGLPKGFEGTLHNRGDSSAPVRYVIYQGPDKCSECGGAALKYEGGGFKKCGNCNWLTMDAPQ